MIRSFLSSERRLLVSPGQHVVTGAAVVITVGLCILIGWSTMFGAILLALLTGGLIVWRIGLDRAFIWLLVIPWQFLPVIKANMLLNPWIWISLLRLLTKRKSETTVSGGWTTAVLAFIPALTYIVSSITFGVAELSLLTWTIPALIVGTSFFMRRPDSDVIRSTIFQVGCVFAVLILVEFLTHVSFNNLLSEVPGVGDYLRGSRALGPAGNPLFSSAVLLVAFFAIPRDIGFGNVTRAIFILALLMTGSKSAIIGLAVALPVAVFALGLKRSFGFFVSFLLGVILILTALPGAAISLMSRFSVFENLQESDPDRAFTTRFVLESILQRPLGGSPVGSVLREKQVRSPVENGDIFGIESAWLAMASDVGVVVVLLIAAALCWKLVRGFRRWESSALLALFVSLFFWNGLYGAWVIVPLWCCVVFSKSSELVGQPKMQSNEDTNSISLRAEG